MARLQALIITTERGESWLTAVPVAFRRAYHLHKSRSQYDHTNDSFTVWVGLKPKLVKGGEAVVTAQEELPACQSCGQEYDAEDLDDEGLCPECARDEMVDGEIVE